MHPTEMLLYFASGTCALSPHIILRESGLRFDLIRVSLGTKKTEKGDDYLAINPKGYVPTLELADGRVLTEGPAIVQFIADSVPEKKLVPPVGTFERARLQEWLNFISTEVHKSFSPLFSKQTPEEYKSILLERIASRLDYIEKELADRPFLLGPEFSVADAYLYTVLRWSESMQIELTRWPAVASFFTRVGDRASVKEALAAERAGK